MLIVCLAAILLRASADPLIENAKIKATFVGGGTRTIQLKSVDAFDGRLVPNVTHLRLTDQTLPTIREGSFRDLPELRVLQLPKCNVLEIKRAAFENVPQLDRIQLQDNVIAGVDEGVFNFLNVSQLFLHRNQIAYIAAQAFDNMPRLRTIKLNKNKLAAWDANWFANTPDLSEVYFRRNLLDGLPEHAFKHFVNLQHGHPVDKNATNVYLSSNDLQKVSPLALKGVARLGHFYIDRNNLSDVPRGLFASLHSIQLLSLRRNRIAKLDAKMFDKVQHLHTLDVVKNDLQCVPAAVAVKAAVLLAEDNFISCNCTAALKRAIDAAQSPTKLRVGRCINENEEEDDEEEEEEDDDEDDEEEYET